MIWPRLALLSFLFTPAALIVTGCGSDGPGAIWVDPGKYTFYKCDDLARRWKALITREDELRGLIEKANESAAGAVIGSVAYRSDYEVVLSEVAAHGSGQEMQLHGGLSERSHHPVMSLSSRKSRLIQPFQSTGGHESFFSTDGFEPG